MLVIKCVRCTHDRFTVFWLFKWHCAKINFKEVTATRTLYVFLLLVFFDKQEIICLVMKIELRTILRIYYRSLVVTDKTKFNEQLDWFENGSNRVFSNYDKEVLENLRKF